MDDLNTLLAKVISSYKADKAAPVQQAASVQQVAPVNDPILTASNPPNGRMLQFYQKQYGSFIPPELLADKAAIMKTIDDLSLRVSRLSPGADSGANGGFRIERLKNALADIYGINNYTPKGFVPPAPVD